MHDQREKNVRRSWLLIIGFVLAVLAVGWGFGELFGGGFIGLAIAAVVAIAMTWTSWYSGDRIVLRMSRAREVSATDEPRLHNLIEGLAIAAGLPKPRVYIVDESAPNAFATGRDPAHSSIAVTTGLIEKLNRVELEGVVAHELAHIQNRDTLVMAIVGTLVGVLVLLADWTLRAFFWGRAGRRNDAGNSYLPFLLFGLIAAVLMPLFAKVMHGAVSRRREFLADLAGVQLTRYPPGLIGALEKLKSDTTVVDTAVRATGHLWIESPLQEGEGFMGRVNKLFNTHPPLEDRIKVLREL